MGAKSLCGWLGLVVGALASGLAFAATPVSFREYIYSDTSAYGPIFNTGVYPDKTTRVVMTFKKDKTDGNQVFYGVRSGGFDFVDFTDATDGTMMSFRFGSKSISVEPSGYEIGTKATLDQGPDGIFLDGRQLVAASALASPGNGTSTLPLALFTIQDGTKGKDSWYDEWGRAWKGYCYDFKAYKGGTCVARYYPCLDSDGTACFYDTVSKTLVYRATDYVEGHKYNRGSLTLSDNVRDDIRLNHGVLEFTVTGTANDSNFGSVTSSAEWCAVGGSVSLTATPASGITFLRWEGDVGAIVSGTATDATITVSPTVEAVSLKAVFAGMVVANRTLSILVPAGETCTDDYTPHLANVTNVVKLGGGALRLKAMSTYTGDWHIDEGEVQFKDAYSFGSTSAGVVYVASGATLFALPAPNSNALKGKHVYIAGKGTQVAGEKVGESEQDGICNIDRLGVLVGPSRSYSGTDSAGKSTWGNNSSYSAQGVYWHLTGDATYWQPGRPLYFHSGSIDAAGHVFTLTGAGGGGNIFLTNNEVITNSAAMPATLEICGRDMKNHIAAVSFVGGPANVVDARSPSYPLSVEGVVTSDWTLKMGGKGMGGAMDQNNPDGASAVWNGPIAFEGRMSFYVHDKQGYALNLKGSIAGDADAGWVVTRGHSLNVHSTNNTFAGTIEVNSNNGGTYVSRLKMCKGSVFSAKSLTLNASNFVMDDETVFTVAPTTVTAGNCGISGGKAGTTIASVVQQGTGTLTLATPATLGELNVAAGTVVLATLPEVKKLVTVAGATLNLGGAVLTVDVFEGNPAAIVNGKVVVRKSFAVSPGSVVDPSVVDWSATGVCVKPAGPLDVGTYEGFYLAGDIDLTTVWGQMADGDYATFTKRTVAEGAHAGQTLVEMTVTKTPPTATWSATRTGGAWSGAANWNGAPAPTAAAVTFPKAEAATVPVTVDRNATLYGLTTGTGNGSATDTAGDWFNPFGYSFTGEKSLLLGSEVLSFVFGAGQNTIDVPLIGSGELSLSAPLYPATNLVGVVHSRLTLGPKALQGFTGTLKVNLDNSTYHAPVVLDTTGFTGSLTMRGAVALNSLDFVTAGGSLTLSGWGEFAYTGDEVEIPSLALAPNAGNAVVVSNVHDIAVRNLTVSRTDASLLKRGAGALKILGNGNYTFKDGTSPAASLGFAREQDVHYGVAASYRRNAIAIADGTLEIGVKDDPNNAPTLTVSESDPYYGKDLSGYNSSGICLGNAWSQSKNPTLKINNGHVKVSTLSPAMYTGYNSLGWTEPFDSVHTVEVNGGTLEANCVFSRIGNIGWPRGSHVYTVNGGAFKVNGFFNLTQLIPENGKSSTYKTTNPRTFTINDGTFDAPVFRMAYSRGWSWDGKVVSPSYGDGLQPDSYLNVNGGVFTASEFLMANDRADSDSWINLNGGTLKVNLLTNTNARCVFTFNGGTYAPLGKVDYATVTEGGKLSGERAASDDILKFKGLKTANVAAGGAVFDTSLMNDPAATFVVEQALLHDPACGEEADGGLVKKGTGTLELAGANTFTGPISVEGGTLVLADKTALLPKANTVALAPGAKLGLKSGMVKLVSLEVDGEALPSGVYGSSASGASKVDDTLFTGAGQFLVGKVGFVLVFR